MDMVTVEKAKLPVNYEHAKEALANCSRVDECQEWANKAEAMASYYRQSKDLTMRKMADRIQARAVRRCGELLKQIPPQAGKRTDLEPDGGVPTRLQVATEAGLSDHQRVTAVRVATIPEKQFLAAVDSDTPPTVTQLAEIGRQPRPVSTQASQAKAKEARDFLRVFATFCSTSPAQEIALASDANDARYIRQYVGTIDGWIDRLISELIE